MSKNYFLGNSPKGYAEHTAPMIMFQEDRGYDPELTKALIEARYNPNPPSFIPQFQSNREKFIKNAGAVALYDKNNQRMGNAYSSFSEPYNIYNPKKTLTSYGHSERTGMRDLLNDYIPFYEDKVKNNIKNYGNLPSNIYNLIYDYLTKIKPPKYYTTSSYYNSENYKDDQQPPTGIPNDLYQLVEKAPQYKEFLEETGAIVKMLSERQDCNSNGPGGNCGQFIKTILPKGSSYGYLVPRSSVSNETNDISRLYQSGILNKYTEYKLKQAQQKERSKRNYEIAQAKLAAKKPLTPQQQEEIQKNKEIAQARLASKKQRINPPGTSISTSGSPSFPITPYNTYNNPSMSSSSAIPSSMSTSSSPSSFSGFSLPPGSLQSPLQTPTTQYNSRLPYPGFPTGGSLSSTSSSSSSYHSPYYASSSIPSIPSTRYNDPFAPPILPTPTNQPPPNYLPPSNSSASSTSSSSSYQPYQRRKEGGVIRRLLN